MPDTYLIEKTAPVLPRIGRRTTERKLALCDPDIGFSAVDLILGSQGVCAALDELAVYRDWLNLTRQLAMAAKAL